MAPVDDLDFDPVDLLRSELEAPDRWHRLRAVKGLDALARVCEPAGTRSKLVKVVSDHVLKQEEDEVQYKLAQSLGGTFVDRCGGPDHAHLLFAPLQTLARVEETMVRQSAVASLRAVFAKAAACETNGAETAAAAVDVVENLAEEAKDAPGFGAKCSAAALCAAAATLLEATGAADDDKRRLRKAYARVAAEDSPIVRRAAASQLADVCRAVGDADAFVEDLKLTLTHLVEDDHDCVKLLAVEQLGAILEDDGGGGAKAAAWAASRAADLREDLAREQAETGVEDEDGWMKVEPGVAVVLDAATDASWRVRESVARAMAGYVGYLARLPAGGDRDKGKAGEAALDMYAALFEDAEVEVRVAAVRAAPAVASAWTKAFAAHADCVNALGEAAKAQEIKVRTETGTALTQLLGVLSPRAPGADAGDRDVLKRAQASLFDAMAGELLGPQNEDAEVRLATLRELKQTIPLLEADLVTRVADMVKQSHTQSLDKKEGGGSESWRIYTALVALYPEIAAVRGKAAFEFDLLDEFLRSFENKIAAVRVRSVNVLAALRELRQPGDGDEADRDRVFDGDWLMTKVGDSLEERYSSCNNNNLYRITFVQAYRNLAHANSDAKHMDKIVLFLCGATRDDVANVRFTAVAALGDVAAFVSDQQANTIRCSLNDLKSDEDLDVQNYCQKALASL